MKGERKNNDTWVLKGCLINITFMHNIHICISESSECWKIYYPQTEAIVLFCGPAWSNKLNNYEINKRRLRQWVITAIPKCRQPASKTPEAWEKYILHFFSENVSSDMQFWKSSLCDVTTGTTITEDTSSNTFVPPSETTTKKRKQITWS